jgi:hypothetical protein
MGNQNLDQVYPPLFVKNYYIDNCNIEALIEWLINYFEEKKKGEGYKSAEGIIRILSVRHVVSTYDGNLIRIEGDFNGDNGPLPDDLDNLSLGLRIDVITIQLIKSKNGVVLKIQARPEYDIEDFEKQLNNEWINKLNSSIPIAGSINLKQKSSGRPRDQVYDQAFQENSKNGKDQTESFNIAYKYFLIESKVPNNVSSKDLKGYRDSFKKAMKLRANK